MNVKEEVHKTIAEHRLLALGDRVVVGVSGGPDSLALLHVLNQLRDELQISLHVAHLNHQLRDAESDADAQFVMQTAEAWNLSATIQARDVRALASAQHLSLEEAARYARYSFLAEVAEQVGAGRIAVAHNADDQVETVLMHFLRGAGLAGLRGMPYDFGFSILDFGFENQAPNQKSQIRVVRPLLDVPRADVLAYCSEHGLTPRQDASNLDTTLFRNRLRHEVLPYLEKLNPNLRQVLLHTSHVLADDHALLEGEARAAYARVAHEEAGAIVFSLEAWRALPPALQRGTLRAAVQQLRHHLRDIDWVHVEDARRVALEKGTGAQATLPGGLVLVVGYDRFAIRESTAPEPSPDIPLLKVDRLELAVPGATPLPESAWMVETEITDHEEKTADRWTAFLDADEAGSALALRHRRPGDRFQPAGMHGQTKSLHEFMIDGKIPQSVRGNLPILVAGDHILWVCGWRVDERARTTPSTRRFLRVTFKR
jgi:tRNA(Ile)-lysidine synthetase-like protein